jgi:hypothetical protein
MHLNAVVLTTYRQRQLPLSFASSSAVRMMQKR